MNFLRLLTVFVSYLLLAAHFLKLGWIPLVVLSLLLPFFLIVKKLWIVRIIQFTLVLGALEWLRTLLEYIEQRELAGVSWIRLAIILGSVILFTAGSALVFQSKALKELYK